MQSPGAGHQWDVAWTPWLRAGWNHAGDADPGDDAHNTFMPPALRARKYALSTAYTFMNADDLFVQAIVRPRRNVTIRADVHRLGLASAADRWDVGSGPTRRRGAIFGYAGRTGGRANDLGTVVESAVDWVMSRRFAINGYVGRMAGGDVVRATFARDRLTFAYLESAIQF